MNWEVRIMPLKKSCFNQTLFRKNLARFWPVWGLASVGGALFPLVMLMQLLRYGVHCTQEDMLGIAAKNHFGRIIAYRSDFAPEQPVYEI